MTRKIEHHRLSDILKRSVQGTPPSEEDIRFLLSCPIDGSLQEIMGAACRVRELHFADRVFLYGFIYISTYCRNHCAFCFYREGNPASPRYRKNIDDVVEIAGLLADSGVHLLDLTMGEDPRMHDTGDFSELIHMVRRIKRNTGLPVMVSPGVVPNDTLEALAQRGTDWYALYQETHNPDLFERLRPGQCFEDRKSRRLEARRAGMLIEDGALLGVGETPADRAGAISAMRDDDVDQARVMSLVPQKQTPFALRPGPPRELEALCIAVMRLSMPDRLIPASLDVDGIRGLKLRMEAGANVVTSIIPPAKGLAGVSQSTLDIDQGLRGVPEVTSVLVEMGLKTASAERYGAWMTGRKQACTEGEDGYREVGYRGRPAPGNGGRLSGSGGRL